MTMDLNPNDYVAVAGEQATESPRGTVGFGQTPDAVVVQCDSA